MLVRAVRSINAEENNRVDFLITEFDYRDGIDFLANQFEKEYKTTVAEEIDGLWYRILKIRKGTDEFCLAWHEDIGNYMYCSEQNENTLRELEQMLNTVIARVNIIFGRKDDNGRF